MSSSLTWQLAGAWAWTLMSVYSVITVVYCIPLWVCQFEMKFEVNDRMTETRTDYRMPSLRMRTVPRHDYRLILGEWNNRTIGDVSSMAYSTEKQATSLTLLSINFLRNLRCITSSIKQLKLPSQHCMPSLASYPGSFPLPALEKEPGYEAMPS